MFERFNDEARAVVAGAQDEARQLRHPNIGVEHLLVSMAEHGGRGARLLTAHGVSAERLRTDLATLDGDPLDPAALAALGIDLDRVREATEARLGPGALDAKKPPMPSGHIPFSKPAKKVLELAVREAIRLKSREINSVYLLLGLLREIESTSRDQPAAQLLARQGIDVVAVRTEAERLVADQAA